MEVRKEEIINVTGAGDSFVGLVLADLVRSQVRQGNGLTVGGVFDSPESLEKTINRAQRAAVMSLGSDKSVSPLLGSLRSISWRNESLFVVTNGYWNISDIRCDLEPLNLVSLIIKHSEDLPDSHDIGNLFPSAIQTNQPQSRKVPLISDPKQMLFKVGKLDILFP
jgi:hypothetical protein